MTAEPARLDDALQVIYLLNLASSASLLDPALQPMQLAARTFSRMIGTFSPDNTSIAVSWHPCFDERDQHFEVYNRQGQQLCELQTGGGRLKYGPDLAFTSIQTVAAAHQTGWKVWELSSGQLLESKELLSPPVYKPSYPEGLAPAAIAASRCGSKLAVFALTTSALELFDAVTLQPLTCVLPSGGQALGCSCRHMTMTWANSSTWLLLGTDGEIGSALSWHLRVLTLQPGGKEYKQVFSDTCQRLQTPAISPDGLFVCTIGAETNKKVKVMVHSTQLGELILGQSISHAEQKQYKGRWGHKDTGVFWSHGGKHLIMRASACGAHGQLNDVLRTICHVLAASDVWPGPGPVPRTVWSWDCAVALHGVVARFEA